MWLNEDLIIPSKSKEKFMNPPDKCENVPEKEVLPLDSPSLQIPVNPLCDLYQLERNEMTNHVILLLTAFLGLKINSGVKKDLYNIREIHI